MCDAGHFFLSLDAVSLATTTEKASVLAEDGPCVNLLLTVKSLYVLNGFVAVLLYLPQIYNACKNKNHAQSLSVLTFGGWCIGSLVTALYAWLYVRDGIFTAISLGNMVGSGAILLIAVYSLADSRRCSCLAQKIKPFLDGSAARHEADCAAGLAQQLP